MLHVASSLTMARTTVDIDAAVLRDLKRRGKLTGKSLGQLISELVAAALAQEEAGRLRAEPFLWISRPMGARVDLEDKEALYRALDSE
jgi:hypothetical protein